VNVVAVVLNFVGSATLTAHGEPKTALSTVQACAKGYVGKGYVGKG
jgi:hypothetical protein